MRATGGEETERSRYQDTSPCASVTGGRVGPGGCRAAAGGGGADSSSSARKCFFESLNRRGSTVVALHSFLFLCLARATGALLPRAPCPLPMFGAVKVVGDAAAAAAAERALAEEKERKEAAHASGAGAGAGPGPAARDAWMTDPSLARQRAEAGAAVHGPSAPTAAPPPGKPDIDAVRPAGLSRPGGERGEGASAPPQPPPRAPVAGDGGASWRLKALQRAQAQVAGGGGGSVAEVRKEE